VKAGRCLSARLGKSELVRRLPPCSTSARDRQARLERDEYQQEMLREQPARRWLSRERQNLLGQYELPPEAKWSGARESWRGRRAGSSPYREHWTPQQRRHSGGYGAGTARWTVDHALPPAMICELTSNPPSSAVIGRVHAGTGVSTADLRWARAARNFRLRAADRARPAPHRSPSRCPNGRELPSATTRPGPE